MDIDSYCAQGGFPGPIFHPRTVITVDFFQSPECLHSIMENKYGIFRRFDVSFLHNHSAGVYKFLALCTNNISR